MFAVLKYCPSPQDPTGCLCAFPRRHTRYAELSLCWDEENRLIGFSDCHNAGFYQYDASGERTYKLTGGYTTQNIQGHWWSYNLLDNPTLYYSPYLVATPKGYTKHYYAESERIASRIGGGGLADIAQAVVNIGTLLNEVFLAEEWLLWDEDVIPNYYGDKQNASREQLTDVMMCASTDPLVEENRFVELRTYWHDNEDPEPDCYWYHPDHLGSSSWITYSDGSAVQHLHYLPWGEDFVDQRSTNWNAMYTFSAKEKDAETGYSYFGSRYYSSDLSIWLSVDPMSDKYPSTSPYAYCRNNPVILIDQYGKFDTRAEARQYRKEHHTGGIVKKNSEMDNFAGKYSIDNKREYVSYTKPQHIEDDASTHLHGLSSDGVVKSPIAHDPRTGSKKFDDFENKMTQTGIAVGQGLATALPITSQVNDIMILRKGENLFDDKATESDKAWAIIDLATLGVGKTFKLLGKSGVPIFEKAADIIEDIGMGLGAHSGILTTKNKSKNGEKRKK